MQHGLVLRAVTVANFVNLIDAFHNERKTTLGSVKTRHPAEQLVGHWSAPPKLPPLPSFSDGPYTGNGDLGITWGGKPESVTTYISKKDFWTGAFFEELQRRWGMLLAATIVWDAPELAGAQYESTMELWTGEVNFTFTTSNGMTFSSNTFIGQVNNNPAEAGANFFVTEFGTDGGDMNLKVTILPGNPAVRETSYKPGAAWGGSLPDSVWTARNNSNETGPSVNPYQPGPGLPHDVVNDTKLTAAITVNISSNDGRPQPHINTTVDRDTGIHTLSFTLRSGRRYVLIGGVACNECGKQDSVQTALLSLKSVDTQGKRAQARNEARLWWSNQWATTPSVQHFSHEADKYYYGTLFTMAAAKRLGTVGIDRQGPFMTQDNAIWPYICTNYNLQAPYYGMLATNQSWMLEPMFDSVMLHMELYKSRAADLLINVAIPQNGKDNPPTEAYGHYSGIEMPGHIGPYSWMWDGSGEGQDAGQRFDAPFTAMMMVDYYDFTQNMSFLESTCYPFLRETISFLESYVRNDSLSDGGYLLHIHHGCAQELCPQQPAFPKNGESRWHQSDYGDTTADLAFFKLALRSIIRLSSILQVDSDKIAHWEAMLTHMADYTIAFVNKTQNVHSLNISRLPPAPSVHGYQKQLGAIGLQPTKNGQSIIQIHCDEFENYTKAFNECVTICFQQCESVGGCTAFSVLHPHTANDGRISCQLYSETNSENNTWWTFWTKNVPTPGYWPGSHKYPGPVFAISANSTDIPFTDGHITNYAIVYTAALYPATDLDVVNNSTWLDIATRTVRNLPAVPYNGAQQVWNAAVRIGISGDEIVGRYQTLLLQGMLEWPSFKVDFGSSNGMENAGLIDAMNDMLMQSWRGYIDLFPCWPRSKVGSFSGLIARGGFVVAANFSPQNIRNSISDVVIRSTFGVRCAIRSPWGSAPNVTTASGASVHVKSAFENSVYTFSTDAGQIYYVAE